MGGYGVHHRRANNKGVNDGFDLGRYRGYLRCAGAGKPGGRAYYGLCRDLVGAAAAGQRQASTTIKDYSYTIPCKSGLTYHNTLITIQI